MKRVERRQFAHGARENSQGAIIAFGFRRLEARDRQPLFDLDQLLLGRAHHARDHRRAPAALAEALPQ